MTNDSEAAGRRPAPLLDHVMVLLDAEAYREVTASGFLRGRFARIKEKKADSSVAGQYATLGVAGDNTLIELFDADMLGGASPLSGGLVFSFEQQGESAAARAELDASGEVTYHHDLVERVMPGSSEQRPWYHLISVNLGEGSPLLLFMNEVTPDYFTSVGARSQDGALRRCDYLDAVVGSKGDRVPLMRDITGVTLAVRAERARRIAAALAAFGYVVTGTVDGADGLELSGPGLAVRLRVDESGPERVTRIDMALAGEHAPVEFEFGKTSRLVIASEGKARWLFD